jgi:FkbM family methyltransferase
MSNLSVYFQSIDVARPFTFVDVGAMGGVPAQWQRAGNGIRVVAFEPDEREFKKLTSTSQVTYLPFALSEKSAPLTFHIAKAAGKSSLYPPAMDMLKDFPDSARYTTSKTVAFPSSKVRSLSQALFDAKIADIDFLKLDTQGSELDILKGAGDALASVVGVEVEVEFARLYRQQPLFRDVDAFMDSKGFVLMDLRRAFWKRQAFFDYVGKGQLVCGDALYFRTPESLVTLLSGKPKDVARDKVLKTIIAALVYRCADYAVDVLVKAADAGIFSSQEKERWIAQVKRDAQSWSGVRFPGSALLAKIFRKLAETFPVASYLGWADGDRHIGNVRNV